MIESDPDISRLETGSFYPKLPMLDCATSQCHNGHNQGIFNTKVQLPILSSLMLDSPEKLRGVFIFFPCIIMVRGLQQGPIICSGRGQATPPIPRVTERHAPDHQFQAFTGARERAQLPPVPSLPPELARARALSKIGSQFVTGHSGQRELARCWARAQVKCITCKVPSARGWHV